MVPGAPAQHDQVGAGGQADQRPARVPVNDVLADRDAGVPGPPLVQQLPRRLAASVSAAWRIGSSEKIGPARERSASGMCQEWIAIRLAWRNAASSNAKASAAGFSSSSMPMPTSGGSGSAAARTTTTGQDACVAACRLTDPSIIAANSPVPREPTTVSLVAPDAPGVSLRVVAGHGVAADHPGQQCRGGDDPQRGAAQRLLPDGPVDRPH